MGIRRWGKSLAPGKWPSCHSLGWRTLKWIYNLLRLILELFLGLRSWRWQSWEVLESLGKILWNHQWKGHCDWTMCWNMHLHSFFSWWKKNKDRRMQKKSAWCHERSEKFDFETASLSMEVTEWKKHALWPCSRLQLHLLLVKNTQWGTQWGHLQLHWRQFLWPCSMKLLVWLRLFRLPVRIACLESNACRLLRPVCLPVRWTLKPRLPPWWLYCSAADAKLTWLHNTWARFLRVFKTSRQPENIPSHLAHSVVGHFISAN